MIKLPRVSQCCCFELRTGSLIIGYFNIILSLGGISGTGMMLRMLLIYIDSGHAPELYSKRLKEDPHPPLGQIPIDEAKTYLYAFYISMIVLNIINLVLNIFLVVGVHQNNPKFVRWYFIGAFIIFVISTLPIIAAVVLIGVLASFPILIATAIQFYFLMVVQSTYLEMEEQQGKPNNFEMYNRGPGGPQQAPLMN